MIFNKTRVNALAAGVALGVASMAVQAADQPSLVATGPKSGAAFTGGATLNNSASFQSLVPASEPFDVVGVIAPAPADVGQSGSLVAVVELNGQLLNLNAQNEWVPLDFNNVLAFDTGLLSGEEKVTILDDFVGTEEGVAGSTVNVFFGYHTGDVSQITYTGSPVSVQVAAEVSGCPAGTTENAATFEDKPVCNIPADRFLTDMHLTDNAVYFVNGTVFIGSNTVNTPDAEKVTLTIDPGVKIIAEGGQTALVIDRGGKVFANGTAAKPIIMTSSQDDGSLDALNARGLWGGLTISGSATQNTASGVAVGEGSTGEYGGGDAPNDEDSSGAVTYVQIRYAGFPITSDDELNTISLQGVGSGTILDYIHSHNGADDGIEFYGGTVNAKHILITGQDDDALDWTNGWTGNLQHVVIKHTTSGDNCIEADNLGGNPTATPRSNPTVANLTCITSLTQKGNGHAFELKAGTGMQMFNSVIGGELNSTEGCILIAGDETFIQSGSSGSFNGTLRMENSLITSGCASALAGEGTFTTEEWFAAQANSSSGTVDLGGTEGWTNGSAVNAVSPAVIDHPFFDAVNYIGGVKNDSLDWTTGWTFDYD